MQVTACADKLKSTNLTEQKFFFSWSKKNLFLELFMVESRLEIVYMFPLSQVNSLGNDI